MHNRGGLLRERPPPPSPSPLLVMANAVVVRTLWCVVMLLLCSFVGAQNSARNVTTDPAEGSLCCFTLFHLFLLQLICFQLNINFSLKIIYFFHLGNGVSWKCKSTEKEKHQVETRSYYFSFQITLRFIYNRLPKG